MAHSSFALVLGVLYYLIGFPVLFSEKKAIAWKRRLAKDDVLVRLVAAAFLAMAVLTLKTDHMITMDADGLVVLFAWITLLKSLVLAWWPQKAMRWKANYEDAVLSNPTLHIAAGLMLIFLGALFSYLGVALV